MASPTGAWWQSHPRQARAGDTRSTSSFARIWRRVCRWPVRSTRCLTGCTPLPILWGKRTASIKTPPAIRWQPNVSLEATALLANHESCPTRWRSTTTWQSLSSAELASQLWHACRLYASRISNCCVNEIWQTITHCLSIVCVIRINEIVYCFAPYIDACKIKGGTVNDVHVNWADDLAACACYGQCKCNRAKYSTFVVRGFVLHEEQ